MVKSIRWRLQFWYAVVLLAAVRGFASYLYYGVRTSRYREIDADIVVAANHLSSTLRTWPREELESPNPLNRESLASRPRTAGTEYHFLSVTPSGWPVVDGSTDRY